MIKKEREIRLPRNYIVWLTLAWLMLKVYQKPEPELIAVIYFIIIGFILSEVYMTYIKRHISVVVEQLPQQVNKGEKLSLKLTIFNTAFLPAPYLYIFLKDTYHIVPEQINCLCMTLPPHSHKEYTFTFEVTYSGVERVGIEKIIMNDFMELVRRKLDFSWQQQVIILPQPKAFKGADYLLHYISNNQDEEVDAKQSALMEEGEVSYELKPYIEGQSQRLVHWKLVAQRDIYMVREREQIVKLSRERLVIIDPLVTLNEEKLTGMSRWMRSKRINFYKSQHKRKAKIVDKLVNGTISYLLQVLKMEESIALMYYGDSEWQTVQLKTLQDLEGISDKISSCMLSGLCKLEQRWPDIPDKNYSQRVVISAKIDKELRTYIEDEDYKVLELQQRSAVTEEAYSKYWYLTDDYQVIRNG